MPKLTERFVAGVLPNPSQELFHWDDELKGLGLRVMPSGRKIFFIQYRNASGRSRRFKIGAHGRIKAEAARSKARELLGKIETGADPMKDRAELRNAPTVKDLAQDYLERHAPKKRPSSRLNDRLMIERFVLPRFGGRLVAEVARRELESLHLSLQSTPYQANRVIALASTMFGLAVNWGWRADNPTRGIRRFPECNRERWLNNDELGRLSEALARFPGEGAANAIRLLILTGSRRGEVLGATWSEFDLSRGTWTKPSHHTKQKRTEHVPLSSAALTLLADMRRADPMGAFLFPGRAPDRPLQDLKGFWKRVVAEADISNVRLHDLRHTYASHLVSSGFGLPIVAKLLGHTQIATTQRYAHLADDPLRAATNRFGAKFDGLTKNEPGEIINLDRG